jgi:hypothetical protein
MKDKCIDYWNKFSKYKETAEQHEFTIILQLDLYLTPRYNKLLNNFEEERAKKFIKSMELIFDNFGIEYEKL